MTTKQGEYKYGRYVPASTEEEEAVRDIEAMIE